MQSMVGFQRVLIVRSVQSVVGKRNSKGRDSSKSTAGYNGCLGPKAEEVANTAR